ncbi:hypothetical protein DL546_007221 [Coniochaeta pulveracea]|uniref:Heterokaryon incompatibility domain-containing protein n=1 Tax=Coniochaeta pulveracea TaxID=177199 RepID=A0A420YIT8_9PEZI|nr:hypothetical protein DL546_007221 [Coniochaeta pulveracea]
MATKYEPNLYEPLPERRSIRLLAIDVLEEVVSCRLVPATLDDPGISHLALSYAWGNPSRTRRILCNGHDFEATESLEGALRQLGPRYPGRLFWIDAISINQQDVSERATQVQIMKDIYRSAENVVIYLGDGFPGLDRAMDLFQQLESSARSLAGVADFFVQTGLSASTIRKSKAANVALIQELRRNPKQLLLPSLLWYTRASASTDPRDRIFALYGLVAPSERDLVSVGFLQVDYKKSVKDVFRDMMVGYIDHYHSLELMSEAMQDDRRPIPELPSWVPDWTRPMPITDPTSSRHMGFGFAARHSGYTACGHQATIFCKELYDIDPDILRVAGKVVDEVDWVSQALGGLDYQPLPWLRHPGILEKLWEDVMARLGRGRETRHAFWRTLLANADRSGSPATDELYPQFLRFWHDSKIHDQDARRYRAEHPDVQSLSPEEEDRLFRDHALDPEAYGKTMTEEDYAAQQAWQDWVVSYNWPCTSAPDCRHCAVLSEMRAELSQNGITVSGPSPALPFRERDPFIDEFFCALGKDHRLITCDWHLDILTRLRATLQNRTFLITKGGLMGLGPKFTRPGDIVAILSGARVPIILRGTGRSKKLWELGVGTRLIQDYTVVGDSYVHGIMNGEAVRDVDWENGGHEVLDLV